MQRTSHQLFESWHYFERLGQISTYSNAGNPERFRTARWSAILVAVQNFASDEAAILRREIGCIVSDPADIDQEFHALCDALVAAEVWL